MNRASTRVGAAGHASIARRFERVAFGVAIAFVVAATASCTSAGGGGDRDVVSPESGIDTSTLDASDSDAMPSFESGETSADATPPADSLDVRSFPDAADVITPTDATSPDDGASAVDAGTYNALVLSDRPVAFWDVNHTTGTEPDLTGNGNTGSYHGGAPTLATMPNGDSAADFNGATQYLSVPSNPSMSIPTTGSLTWEGWIRPDVLQFPNSSGGYIDWMGKCASYSPTCEWEARMYDTMNAQNRCNRFSAYAFNPTAGLGSGADFQPVCGLVQAGHWYYVVGEYTTLTQPASCPASPNFPGSLAIWVNGVPWDQASHAPTGCMSQYSVAPRANNSPLNIGTMARDYWFQGAIGKVAIYDRLLTQAQIAAHFRAMTALAPTGSCSATCTL